MRIVLCGQKSFGAAALAAVTDAGHDVAKVFSPLDDSLAHAAFRAGLPHSEHIRVAEIPPAVDLIVCAHAHAYVGGPSRRATRLGAVGYHPSLLPRHRGRDAVRWTIHMGDPVAGGSVYWLTDGVDSGPLARQDWCHVRPGDDASELWRRDLFTMGLRLLGETLADLDRGVIVRVPQDQAVATWEPSWDRPPVFRPELPQIGAAPEGFRVVASRGAA